MRCVISDLLVHIKSRRTQESLTRRCREKPKEKHSREDTAPQHMREAASVHSWAGVVQD